MCYLNSLRLHFAGGFETAPSTVNNDVTHFDNNNFQPHFQLPGPGATNGWWNPEGDHRFKIDCRVSAAFHGDLTAAAATDPILALKVLDRERFPAKIVDLDPQQQLVSTIFGLEVALEDGSGNRFLKGTFAPAPFTDIWTRGTTGGNDERAGAMYQSVLESLQWGNVIGSRFLTELKAAASGGTLSIKFNLDGYSMARGNPGFTRGRVVGTIGPTGAGEPRHFVRGRHFANLELLPGGFPRPRFGINYCVGVLDERSRRIWLDLGNALTTSPSRGPMRNIGTLGLVCNRDGAGPIILGNIEYTMPDWYERTAGIVALPVDRELTDVELAAMRENPLALVLTPPGGAPLVAVSEPDDGHHLRADLFVFRLNPGDSVATSFHATRFGRPLSSATIGLRHDASNSEPGIPPIAVPQSALTFPAATTTGGNGQASIALQAAAPGNPRGYIDGQVYFVSYTLDAVQPLNPRDFLSVLVWDAFTPDEPPTWHGSMRPIFQQYANLYPMMKDFVDLASYDDVSANRRGLIDVLELPQTNSHYMPVTRDLSEAKRMAMIRWLTNVGADSKPLLGTPPPAPAAVPRPAAAAAVGEEPVGSKALAAEMLQRQRALARRTK